MTAPVNWVAETSAMAQTSGRVTTREYDTAALKDHYHMWDLWPRRWKVRALARREPLRESTQENTTCVEHHERITDSLDASQPAPPPIRYIAVGRSGSTTDSLNRSLNDHIYDAPVTGYDDNGTNGFFTALLGEQEANVDTGAGEALREGAAISGDQGAETRYFLNHSLFATPIDKDASITATITVELISEPKP